MRILITGGAGFIGSNLAEKLCEDNDVIVLDNLYLGRLENLEGLDVKFVKGSVLDNDLVDQLCKGVDYVFHNAAFSSSPMFKENPQIGVHVNVLGFMHIMNASLKNAVKKVIYASTSSMYNGNKLPYTETQQITTKTFYESSFRCREMIAQTYYFEHGLSSIGLRYFSVYGPKEKHKGQYANNITQFLWNMIKGNSPVIYGDGTQRRDFTFVEDVVQANILAMHSDIESGIFNVGTGVDASFNKVVNILHNLLGTEIKPQYVSNPIKNYVHETVADLSNSRKYLGYNPQWSLERGIRNIIDYYTEVPNYAY